MKKLRFILTLTICLLSTGAFGQPAETNYLGIEIPRAPLLQVPPTSDGPFPIGFSFTFYGNTYTDFYVSKNGRISFDDPATAYNTEADIPNAALPNNFIAPFWDNLTISSTGNILYDTIGAAPNRKLVVQFKNMMLGSPLNYMGTFSVILYETSNNIQFQYRQIIDNGLATSHGSSATIGIENADGTLGAKHAFHISNAISPTQAILFTPGSPYIIDPNAEYEGIYLTKSLSLPDPGITSLISPAQDAVIGSDVILQWGEATNASSYTLIISKNSTLSSPRNFITGITNLNYQIELGLDTTYYWGVFAVNATGTTWCEIRKFSTSPDPPLVAVAQTIWGELNNDKVINLAYTGGDASPKTAVITALPAQGKLYQYNAGAKGDEITITTTDVTDPGRNVIYAATGNTGNGVGNFSFKIRDATAESSSALITVNVSPPGIPSVLYVAKSTSSVEIQFDIPMADPSGKENQFTLTANGSVVALLSASLKTGDPNTIILTAGSTLTAPVLVSYTQGTVTSVSGGVLLSFTDQPVTLTAQIINFPQALSLKYNNSPVTLTATASSGLGMAYTSSNLSVATISGNIMAFTTTGTSEITARQAGSTTYAPAAYTKSLTVAKGDQVITFTLPAKTYGNADFVLTASASTGLPITYLSDNSSVATITGNQLHITGAGTSVVTATQAGNTLWNAASLQQTLTVAKASLVVSGDAQTKVYGAVNPALTFAYSGWVNGVETIDTPPIATTTVDQTTSAGVQTAAITVSGGADNNYSLTYVAADFTVTKANLTFTGENKSKEYLAANPALTYTISGFVNSETQSVLEALPDIVTTAVLNSPAGSYPITISGGSDNCYNYLYVDGTLTVTKIAQTITFSGVPSKLRVQETYNLVATSTSGLTVLFESMDPGKATVSGSTLTGVSKGNVEIRAYHPGDLNYDAAEVLATVKIYSNHANVKNLFTPNSDGFNDQWDLSSEMEEWGKCDIKVYNRWGKLVFANPDYDNLWEGTSNGAPLPEGAYYYVIKTQNEGTVTGNVNIVR